MSDDTVRPIRPGILPEMDVERELIEWATTKIRNHFRDHGEGAGAAIALVLVGGSREDEPPCDYVSSWSPTGLLTKTATCAVASLRLADRAMGR